MQGVQIHSTMKHDCNNEIDMHQNLYRLIRPWLQSLRIAGHFVYSVGKNNHIHCNIISIPFFWSLVTLVVSITGSLRFYFDFIVIESEYFRFTPLEKVCQLIMVATYLTTACLVKTLALVNAKKELGFGIKRAKC